MATSPARPVNSSVYDTLGDRWYDAQDDPVALLRAECAHRTPWILGEIRRTFGNTRVRVLDIASGGGFLSNALATHGLDVTGIDTSAAALAVAAGHDRTRSVRYRLADAAHLPFRNRHFHVTCAMDFLEHVFDPLRVIAEASRVLAPGGLFFFHTFNRTFVAWLVVIKGVEWFVKNTPRDLHVLPLFRKPKEVHAMCDANGLCVRELRGQRPDVGSLAFWRLLLTREVPKDFAFRFTPSMRIAYMGVAEKRL